MTNLFMKAHTTRKNDNLYKPEFLVARASVIITPYNLKVVNNYSNYTQLSYGKLIKPDAIYSPRN